jgi:phosphatidylglycerophosphatase A
VVVDEVAGQMIAMLPLSLFAVAAPKTGIIVSFILFRLFDIFKPYPARRFEKLRSGLGIMADDLVAGFYAAVGTSLLLFLL